MKKERILIFPFDLLSHYLRCIELASLYPEYEIHFAASEKYSSFVSKAGYSSFHSEHFNSEKVMLCAEQFNFAWLNEPDIEKVFLSQLQCIENYKPSFVIGDTSPALKMAAEKANVKYISLMNSYMSKYYDLTRPLPDNHYSRQYLEKLPPRLAEKITRTAEAFAFKSVHRPFRKLRKKYGLKKVTAYLDEMEGDETFLCDDPEIFPVKNLPDSYRVLGPLHYSGKSNTVKISTDKPSVCVSLGSTGRWEALSFLNSHEFSHLNIITAGDKNHVLNASHISAYDFLNLDALLPQCRALICHGGNGTVYLSLKHKVQLYCLTSHFEQEYNAKRVAELNLGKHINSDPFKILRQELGFFQRPR